MALRNILNESDPILHKVCRPVEKFDERLWQLLDDMHETLDKAQGVGLAVHHEHRGRLYGMYQPKNFGRKGYAGMR